MEIKLETDDMMWDRLFKERMEFNNRPELNGIAIRVL